MMMTTIHLPAEGQQIRILVIKLRHHGDMLLITPVINSLHQRWPDAQIDVLLYEETREILAAHPFIHQIYGIDRQWRTLGPCRHVLKEAGLLKTLRRQHYSLVINLADQWRSAIATHFTGAPVRIGFDFNKRRSWLWRHCHTQLASVSRHQTQHTVEQNLSILAPLGIPALSNVSMNYRAVDQQHIEALLHKKGIPDDYIVVQPGSRWFFKCWDEEKMAQTISALQQDGHTLVLTSGPDKKEKNMVEKILSRSPSKNVFSLAGELTLRQLAALIDHARLFIGVDSVAMHMAAALKTPCIALFGPSKLTFWHPWNAIGEVIWAGDYGPLPDPDKVDTNTNERYLDAIPVEAVVAAARKQLS